MAAAVADFRPAAAAEAQDQEDRARRADVAAGARPPTSSAGWPPDGAPARRWSASPPSTATGAVDYGRDKLARKQLDAIVVNDISRADIGFDAADNEVTIVTADGERAVAARGEGRGGGGRARRGRRSPRRPRQPRLIPSRSRSWRANGVSRLNRRNARGVRPLPGGDEAARGGRLPRRRRAPAPRRRPRSRQDLDPRGARPGAVPHAAVRGRGARSSRPSSSTRRRTTSRCSASGGRCSSWAGTARRATRWPWPRTCGPSAPTTAATATCRAAGPPERTERSRYPGDRHLRTGGGTAGDVPERARARFFRVREEDRHVSANPVQQEIEERLASAQPEVEVLLAEVVGGETVRLFIDHPDGVTLALCEQVTLDLAEVRERYALEVSSPGSRRPLTKPDHFRRYLGRRATRAHARPPRRPPLVHGRAGRRVGRRGDDRRRQPAWSPSPTPTSIAAT